jgi:predicted nucleic acid-binding protein
MMLRQIVIDASAALSVVLVEDHTERARALCSGVEKLAVPDLWAVECGNGIWKQVRRGVVEAGDALDLLETIARIPATRVDTEPLNTHALAVALSCGVSMYDALYVATTEYIGGTFITADRRLLTALREARWPVQALHISEWPVE